MLFSWRRFGERAMAVFHLDEEPSRLAAGMAVGVFIGVTPFFFLHTILAWLVAFLFRLNKAATVTGAWINLPWFAPFVYAFSLALGEAIVSGDFSIIRRVGEVPGRATSLLRTDPVEQAGAFTRLVWRTMFEASLPLFAGATVVGVAAGLITYYITLEAVRDIRRLGPGRRSLPEEPGR